VDAGRPPSRTPRPRGSATSAISPLIANLFMHYAFDTWLAGECPGVQFERYCDDAVVHCASEEQSHPNKPKRWIVDRYFGKLPRRTPPGLFTA
jgi:hypothetical protein